MLWGGRFQLFLRGFCFLKRPGLRLSPAAGNALLNVSVREFGPRSVGRGSPHGKRDLPQNEHTPVTDANTSSNVERGKSRHTAVAQRERGGRGRGACRYIHVRRLKPGTPLFTKRTAHTRMQRRPWHQRLSAFLGHHIIIILNLILACKIPNHVLAREQGRC